MRRDTHYTALGVPETASQLQIKIAYRNLLKQIHPDTVSTLSPELRVIAESATKEIIEAYTVLSDPDKRRQYDCQLVEARRQFSARGVQVAEPPYQSHVRQITRSAGRSSRRRHRPRRRSSPPHSLRHWALRHPLMAALALVLMFILVILFVYLLFSFVHSPVPKASGQDSISASSG